MDRIPVVDLFAGPGGLGEGFSAFEAEDGQFRPFKIKLSIEKDLYAHRTLELRSFYRQFPSKEDVPDCYYDFLKSADQPEDERRVKLFSSNKYKKQVEEVRKEARWLELGNHNSEELNCWIHDALGNSGNWVLIGGPPCQAYSVVGRSRNKGNQEYVPENDGRQYLYIEYLQILADHRPAIFVMEKRKRSLVGNIKE